MFRTGWVQRAKQGLNKEEAPLAHTREKHKLANQLFQALQGNVPGRWQEEIGCRKLALLQAVTSARGRGASPRRPREEVVVYLPMPLCLYVPKANFLLIFQIRCCLELCLRCHRHKQTVQSVPLSAHMRKKMRTAATVTAQKIACDSLVPAGDQPTC